jgi:hypothetical protein
MLDEAISGSLLTLFLFDVADEARLDELRQVLNAPAFARTPAFREPAPPYAQFASHGAGIHRRPHTQRRTMGGWVVRSRITTRSGQRQDGDAVRWLVNPYEDTLKMACQSRKQPHYAIKIVGRPESDRGGAVKHV